MKSILISIQPQWVEKILNGEKTIEIRKTVPKCEFPCKVYIYCTKGKPYLYRIDDDNKFETINKLRFEEDCFVKDYNCQNGKVVAEFILNGVVKFNIESIMFLGKQQELMQKSQLGGLSLRKYLGNGVGYAWHIDNLKIYDKPKELNKFYTYDTAYNNMFGWAFTEEEKRKYLKRPPQSWCYVEEL